MNYIVGILLSCAAFSAALFLHLDRDRRFFPAMLVVIASFDIVFAVMGGDHDALFIEALILGAFVVVALLGYRSNPWLVVVALALHGTLDLAHPFLVQNEGIPTWWPGFCMTFDVMAAMILGVLLTKRIQPGFVSAISE